MRCSRLLSSACAIYVRERYLKEFKCKCKNKTTKAPENKRWPARKISGKVTALTIAKVEKYSQASLTEKYERPRRTSENVSAEANLAKSAIKACEVRT